MKISFTKKDNTSVPEMDDVSLWKNFISGDTEALKELHYRFYSELFHYGLSINSNTLLVKEAIQDLFVYLWEKHCSLNNVQNIKSYLFRSFRNRLINISKNKLPTIEELDLVEKTYHEHSFEDLLVKNETDLEQKQKVQQLLNSLSDNQREIVFLKFYNNLSYHEIADILDMEYQSVRNSIYRAFKALRKKLETERHAL